MTLRPLIGYDRRAAQRQSGKASLPMHQYLKLTCLVPAMLLTFLQLPRGWAQGYEPPALAGPGDSLPPPPRVEPPVLIEIGGSESPFSAVTVGWQSCRVPCRLYVAPGLQPVIATGKASFITHVEVPRSSARLDLVDLTRSYRVAGAILIPTGIATAASLWAFGLACGRNSGCAVANFTVWPVLGIAAMFTGIGLLGYAARRDRYGLRATPITQPVGALRLTGLAAAPTADGAALGASFAF